MRCPSFSEVIGCKILTNVLDADRDLERGWNGGQYEEL